MKSNQENEPSNGIQTQVIERREDVLSSFQSYQNMLDRDYYWLMEKWEYEKYENTPSQTLYRPNVTDGVIFPDRPLIDWYSYNKVLRHPTVALARGLMVAPMTIIDWSVVADKNAPQTAKWLIESEILTKKQQIVKQGLEGCIDFGWVVFENIYEPSTNDVGEDCIKLPRMKNLLQEITLLRANPYTGAFAGIRQVDMLTGRFVYLPASKVQLFNFDQRGSYWYGNAMLDNCMEAVKSWSMTDKIADSYIRKIAGAHWVISYPVGQTMYKGTMMDNAVIAADFLEKLEANSSFAIPVDINDWTTQQATEKGGRLWDIQNFSDAGATSASYTDILRYKDALIVRAFMLPERAILEGEFGTRAEAVAHAEAAVAAMEMRLRVLVEQLNKQTVNNLLEMNYGPEARDTVRIEVPPITKDESDFIKSTFTSLLQSPDMGYAVSSGIDAEALIDQLNLPKANW